MTEQTTTNLEVLESRAEKALEKAETGWREFAETMREIKESGAHKVAGYRHFQPYYRDVWESRTSRPYHSIQSLLSGLKALGEMEAVAGQDHDLDLGYNEARELRRFVPDPTERVEVWRDFRESGKPLTADRAALREHIVQYKAEGVLDRMEQEGVEIADYPSGPTPEEQAAKAVSELAKIAKDVTPEAAADSMTPGMAQTTFRRQEFLAGWLRRYIGHMQLRLAEHGNLGE